MNDLASVCLAHFCPSCRSATIFTPDATYPRRCAACNAIVRVATFTRDDAPIAAFTLDIDPDAEAVPSLERR